MKINVTEEWCVSQAQLEAGAEVGAGVIALDPTFENDDVKSEPIDDSRVALQRFVELSRRQKNLSRQQLAEQADIDLSELEGIETDMHYMPETRTLYQLANVLGVSQKKLMGLSGLTQPKDVSYVEEAVRYAARSESISRLTPEEQAALDGLIAVLSEK
ncbi:helix-turn-helix transcriptional regulator [Qipengyuania sp. DY56-A-20]|jgi:HTH-type transcriptional regulator, competence development regulator|uniref:Helix-turn-helix transcriptional regulator n=1 Tax=Qipengyuania benthica TaxID=3067651 RepID=A0ABT9HBY9_9SPHN|nr:helix-turn-helix transcriptional regulator [Qipengyuania sp. DY56-A-20]MDP4540844.1 helix-turn-helix transcriptional regulator [Qipengyuania sp. DY56-A-20]